MTCSACHIDGDYVAGEGNPQATVMVVGLAPQDAEGLVAASFAGKSGELLRYVLDAIVGSENIWYTNAIKRCVTSRPTERALSVCSGHLAAELMTVKPALVLGLGSRVTNLFLGTDEPLENTRGMLIPFRRHSLDLIGLFTYDPGYVLRSGGIDSKVGKKWTDDLSELFID